MRQTTTLSILGFTVAFLSLISFETKAAPAENQNQVSVWEKVCNQGVTAACRKAAFVLEERMIEADIAEEETALRTRLLGVSRLGCDKGDVASCAQLYFTDSTTENLKTAKETAEKSCSKGKSESCKILNKINEAAEKSAEITEADLSTFENFLASNRR